MGRNKLVLLKSSSTRGNVWQKSTGPKSKVFPLADLPREILLMVYEHLDWLSIEALRLVCRSIAGAIGPLGLAQLHDKCRTETAALEAAMDRTSSMHVSGPLSKLLRRGLFNRTPPLPCYRCLRWLQCSNMETSEFSYEMVRQRTAREDQRYSTFFRFCFDCGIKNGLYVKGSRWKGRIICQNCKNLGGGLVYASHVVVGESRLWSGIELRYKEYCLTCIKAGSIPTSYAEHVHRLDKFCRYQKTMYRKWEETKAKRRALGVDVGDDGNKWKVWCPVLERDEICNCADHLDSRKTMFKAWIW